MATGKKQERKGEIKTALNLSLTFLYPAVGSLEFAFNFF